MSYGVKYKNKQSQKKKKMDLRGRIWSSSFVTISLIILLLLSFVKVSQEALLRYEINQEIKNLEEQLNDLESKTAKTYNLITYLQTDQYIETEARLKLNLSKPGEKQINLLNLANTKEEKFNDDKTSNFMKWFNYFFK